MKRLFRILGMIPVAFVCAAFAMAAMRVQAERARDVTPLPGRLGQVQIEESFLHATINEVSFMYQTLMVGFLPGMVPRPVRAQQLDPHSLGALKQRAKTPTVNF